MCFKGQLPGATFADGADAYIRAWAQGDAEAAHCLSALSGVGAGLPKNWRQAMVLAGGAAAAGWTAAQKQLAMLGGLDPRDSHNWSAVAASVDWAAWMAPPVVSVFSENPRIRLFPELIPPTACSLLIEEAGDKLVAATVYGRSEHSNVVEETRNNAQATFYWMEGGVLVNLVRERIAAAMQADTGDLEFLTILNYQPGQRFLPHFDFLDPEAPGHAAEIAAAGQRVATFLVSLNDDYEDGGTYFPALGHALRGHPGDGFCFYNVDAAGRPDPASRHAGLPPRDGQKWIISQFVREARAPA